MKKVLLTDDNEDIVELVKLELANAGYQLITAGDGRQAVETALREQPDLVLMDLNMPTMNGFEAARELRKRGYDRPIVVLSGSESKQDRDQAMAAGCNDFITKSMEMAGLERILDHYLQESGGV